MRSIRIAWAGLILSLFLMVSCGGGGGGGGAENPPLPDPPGAVSDLTANAGSYKVGLSWSAVTGADYYNVYWSTSPGVTTATGTKISGVYTPYAHENLSSGTSYYYVVTAVNNGGESGVSNEVSMDPDLPILEANFDGANPLQGWTVTGTWGVTTEDASSPSYSVTDSPGGNYADNSDTYLETPLLDLTAASAPSLSFNYKLSNEEYRDLALVEISTDDGATFSLLKEYKVGSVVFASQTFDLTSYNGSSTVIIRFSLKTNGTVVDDGWYLDDILIESW